MSERAKIAGRSDLNNDAQISGLQSVVGSFEPRAQVRAAAVSANHLRRFLFLKVEQKQVIVGRTSPEVCYFRGGVRAAILA
jgi:hypothetical protein